MLTFTIGSKQQFSVETLIALRQTIDLALVIGNVFMLSRVGELAEQMLNDGFIHPTNTREALQFWMTELDRLISDAHAA